MYHCGRKGSGSTVGCLIHLFPPKGHRTEAHIRCAHKRRSEIEIAPYPLSHIIGTASGRVAARGPAGRVCSKNGRKVTKRDEKLERWRKLKFPASSTNQKKYIHKYKCNQSARRVFISGVMVHGLPLLERAKYLYLIAYFDSVKAGDYINQNRYGTPFF